MMLAELTPPRRAAAGETQTAGQPPEAAGAV